MFDNLLTMRPDRQTEAQPCVFLRHRTMLVALSRGEFLCTPEQICSRDMPAAGARKLRNVADETAPPAGPRPLTFFAHPSCGATPGLGNDPAAAADKLASEPTPIGVSPAAQRDPPAEPRPSP